MRDNPSYALTDPGAVKDLVRSAPWATMVSATDDGPVASHYPFLLDETAAEDEIVLLSHVGKPDEQLHRLGSGPLLVIFAGPAGYISPSWYGLPRAVPTWNFTVVHAYGVPRLLTGSENLRALERLVDRFEDPLPNRFRLRATAENAAYADRIVHGTVGFSLRVTRFVGKNKLSQDKPPEVVDRIVRALREPGPYRNPALADRMARFLPAPGPVPPGLRSAGSEATGATREGGTSEGPGARASGASAKSMAPGATMDGRGP